MAEDVLLVDDDTQTIDALSLIFQTHGIACRAASNGREALEAIRDRLPKLILLDLNMPVLDGIGVVRVLHSMDVVVPTVLMSASIAEVGRHAAELGVAGALAKPFTLAQVAALIHRFF